LKGKLRIIVDGARHPALNMAIDEAIWLNRKSSEYDTLRIYLWRPTGVSLGRSQKVLDSVRIDEIKKRNYVLVRRPTGGATLIHAESMEITYSLVLSSKHEFYTLPVDESAAEIAKGIVIALNNLGLKAHVRKKVTKKTIESNICMVREGSSDIVVEGKKISGSAQVRNDAALLQHGTLVLDVNYEDWQTIIISSNNTIELKNVFTGLKNLGAEIELAKIIESLITGFTEVLDVEYFFGGYTPEEIAVAEDLFENKHSRIEWVLKP